MALSNSTFSDVGGAVSDLFAGFGAEAKGDLEATGLRLKASGDLAEASNYDLASQLAAKNAQFTETSTAIQQVQQQRQNTLQIGGQRAAVAGAGFAESGSALDIMADSARQGALATAVLGQQGLITEAGYQEQAQSYTTMANAARSAAATENQMAQEAQDASKDQALGDFLGGALKGAAAIGTIFGL